MSSFKDLVKQFSGVVHIQDIKDEFNRLVNGINSIVDSINNINDLKDHDYSVGSTNLSSVNYTLTLGALKSALGVYNDSFVVRPPIVKCPGSNNYYKAFPGLYCDESIGIIQTKDDRLDAGVVTTTTTEEKNISTYLTVEKDGGYVFSRSSVDSIYGNITTGLYTIGDTLICRIKTDAVGYDGISNTISDKYAPIINCGDLQIGDIIHLNVGDDISNHNGKLFTIPVVCFYDTANGNVLHEPIFGMPGVDIATYTDNILNHINFIEYPNNSDNPFYEFSSGEYLYEITNVTSTQVTIRISYLLSGNRNWTNHATRTINIPDGYRCNSIFLAVRGELLNVTADSSYYFSKDTCYLMRGDTRYDFITSDETLKGPTTSSIVSSSPKLDKGILLDKQTGEISLSETINNSTIDSIACSKVGTSEMNQNAIANITISNETRTIPSSIPTLKITPQIFNVWNAGGGHDTLSGPCFRLPKGGDRATTCIISWLGKVIWGLRHNSNSDRKHKAAWSYNPIWTPSGISSTFTKTGNGKMHDKALSFKWINK